jgi:hypothetical protein
MNNELFLDIRKSATVKINLDNHIEYVSEYLLDLLDYKVTDFVSKPPRTICHEDMPDLIHDIIGGFIMNYKEGIAVLKHKTKNNDYFWAFTHYKPSYKPDGSFEAFVTRRKPLPSKKLNGSIEDMKYQISKLYKILKEIEIHTGQKQAEKYLQGFLEHKNFSSLDEYYMSFFNYSKKELDEYFAIDNSTPEKKISKYTNLIGIF